MFDIQHDSAMPIHEQLTSQIRAHVASGALKEKLAAAGVDATTRLAIAIDLNRAGFLAA